MKSTENSGLNFEQISVLKSVSGLKFVSEIGAWFALDCIKSHTRRSLCSIINLTDNKEVTAEEFRHKYIDFFLYIYFIFILFYINIDFFRIEIRNYFHTVIFKYQGSMTYHSTLKLHLHF